MSHVTAHEDVLTEPGERTDPGGGLCLNQFHLEDLVSLGRGRSRGHFLHWMETRTAFRDHFLQILKRLQYLFLKNHINGGKRP